MAFATGGSSGGTGARGDRLRPLARQRPPSGSLCHTSPDGARAAWAIRAGAARHPDDSDVRGACLRHPPGFRALERLRWPVPAGTGSPVRFEQQRHDPRAARPDRRSGGGGARCERAGDGLESSHLRPPLDELLVICAARSEGPHQQASRIAAAEPSQLLHSRASCVRRRCSTFADLRRSSRTSRCHL